MATKAEAQNFIEKLQESRNINATGGVKGDANAHSLKRALDLLSKELYSKPTRFIPEIIQNADDNGYAPNIDPTLTLVYQDDGHLWIGSNETGFTEQNVAAICEIADSTKKTTGSSKKGYIGEKGIGFKSVFKVADIVWISSGNFTFKFNRDDHLGMIAPVWAPFKRNKKMDEKTMFCLHIPSEHHRENVRQALLELGAESLLFLRKLRNIHVVAKMRSVSHEFWLHRNDLTANPNCTLTTLGRTTKRPKPKEQLEQMLVFQRTAMGMPEEEKREGITETELIMAFPSCPGGPAKIDRDTYNFLPIRSYGFSFLLHADFILTANRQDILEKNDWNERLKAEACKLFVQAVHYFNETGTLKYEWPRFTISKHNNSGNIMETFLGDLKQQLRANNVIQTQAGDYKPPGRVTMVRKNAKDESGGPLLDESELLASYASTKYEDEDLRILGIAEQSPKEFCTVLKSFPESKLHSKPNAWHAKLVAELLAVNNPKLWKGVKLIPIQGGLWVASGKDVFFAAGIEAPEGIDLQMVTDQAANDQVRRAFFETLGVQEVTQMHVVNNILKRHSTLTRRLSNQTTNSLIDQIWYLFRVGYSDEKGLSSLKMITPDEFGLVSVRELYMNGPEGSFQMTDFFPETGGPCTFIHPLYIAKASGAYHKLLPSWMSWLRETVKVPVVPHLSSSSRGPISPDFRYLIDTQPSVVWLTLVRDHWSYYFSETAVTPANFGLGDVMVQCMDGEEHPLKEVHLATKIICSQHRALETLHFVDIPDPEHPGWTKLSGLGLTVEPDLRLCCSILRNSSNASAVSFNAPAVYRQFQLIQKLAAEKPMEAQEYFSQEPLIPIHDGSSISWFKSGDCRWAAPACLQTFTALADAYPAFQVLFVQVLQIQDANAEDMLSELAVHAGDSGKVNIIRDLLFALSEKLSTDDEKDEQLQDNVQHILSYDIFPVCREMTEFRLTSIKDETWFIADRKRQAECFKGKIFTLHLEDLDVKKLTPFFKYSGLTERYLTRKLVEDTETAGAISNVDSLSQQLQAKARYFSMLINEEERVFVNSKMQRVQVYAAQKMTLRRSVTINSRPIFGEDEVGRVVLEDNDELRLYCLEENIDNNDIPWTFISDRFATTFDLTAEKRNALLSILTTTGKRQIEDILERAGFLDEDFVPETLSKDVLENKSKNNKNGLLPPSAPGALAPAPITLKLKNSPKAWKLESPEDTTFGLQYSGSNDEECPHPGAKAAGKRIEMSKKKSTSHNDKSSYHGSRAKKVASTSSAVPTKRSYADFSEGSPSHQKSEEQHRISRIVTAANESSINDIELHVVSNGAQEVGLVIADFLTQDFDPPKDDDGADEEHTQFHGELFIYKILQDDFEISEDAWTSDLRDRYALDAFLEDSDEFSAFTISEPDTVQRVTSWLVNKDFGLANDWIGRSITYHIDVKATKRGPREPFRMGTGEMQLAREWSESRDDVYIIFRVCNLHTSPKICALVDPLALTLAGKLGVASEDGFVMKIP